jgi:hypothetical protein
MDKTILVEARGPAEPIRNALLAIDGVKSVKITGAESGISSFEIQTRDGADLRESICQRVTSGGWMLRTLDLRRGSLEERFVAAVTSDIPVADDQKREAV